MAILYLGGVFGSKHGAVVSIAGTSTLSLGIIVRHLDPGFWASGLEIVLERLDSWSNCARQTVKVVLQLELPIYLTELHALDGNKFPFISRLQASMQPKGGEKYGVGLRYSSPDIHLFILHKLYIGVNGGSPRPLVFDAEIQYSIGLSPRSCSSSVW